MRLDHSEVRKIGFPISHQLVEREFIIAGGTLEGALKSLKRVSLLILPEEHITLFQPTVRLFVC